MNKWEYKGLCKHQETSLIEELISVLLDEGKGVGQLIVNGFGQARVLFLQNLVFSLHLLPAATHPDRNQREIAAELSQQAHQHAHLPLTPPRSPLSTLAAPGQVCLGDLVDEGRESGERCLAAMLNLCIACVSRPVKDTTDWKKVSGSRSSYRRWPVRARNSCLCP